VQQSSRRLAENTGRVGRAVLAWRTRSNAGRAGIDLAETDAALFPRQLIDLSILSPVDIFRSDLERPATQDERTHRAKPGVLHGMVLMNKHKGFFSWTGPQPPRARAALADFLPVSRVAS